MAIKRNERYPGRFSNPTAAHPLGAFKNRTAPNTQDGSYLEQDWANDWDGFFSRLLVVAGITANGTVDSATSSQYFDALIASVKANLGAAAQRNVGTTLGSNQLPDMSSFTSGPGWVRFPDGTIIQRGTSIAGPVGFPTTITLNIPFTVEFTVATSFDKASNISTECPAFAATPVGLTAFYLMSSRVSGTNNAGANWIAVGK